MTTLRSLAVGLAIALPLLTTACAGTEGRKARYMQRGETFLAEGNLDKARVEFSNALQIDPNDAQARYYAGRIAEKQIKPRDAVANYQAAIEADPEFVAARGALGRLYLIGGLPEKAREVIAPALLKSPGDPQLLTVRGGLRALDGDLTGALEDAEAAVKAAPDDEVAVAFLAAQYQRQNRVDDAIVVLKAGVGKLPDSTDLHVILADLLYRTARTDEALEQLQLLARAHPEVLAHWQRVARLQLLEKDAAGAEESLRAAVTANPGSIEAKSALVTLVGNRSGVPAGLAQMEKFVAAEPKNADLKIAQGQFLEAARQIDKAVAVYRQVIETEKTDASGLAARNRLAALLVQKGDLTAAEALIAEVLKENARDNDALILRAGIAMSRGEAAAAVTDLRAVLRDQPTAVPLLRALARAHQQDGDTALAEEVLRSAVQANPLDTQSRYELASLLTASGRGAQALPVLEQLIRDAPGNIEAREAYFRVQVAVEDFDGARKTASEVRTLRPDLATGPILLGSLAERDGKLAEATAEYEDALRVSNDPSLALASLVRVDLARKRSAQAIERVQTVIGQAPKLATAHHLLGEIHMTAGDNAAAVKAFDAAIAARPVWWAPYRGRSLALMRMKQTDQATASLAQGIKAAGALELYVDLATLREQQGMIDQAIATYEDALKRHPRSLAVANNLAMLLVDSRQDKASLDRASELAQLLAASGQPALLDTAGWVKYRQGAVAEALPLLRSAAEKAPQSSAIRYHLGMAQMKSGDHAAARQSLQAALAANQRFTGAEDARSALAGLDDAGG